MQTSKIPRLAQHKQVLFSQLLTPICRADDPLYDSQVLLLAQQVKEAAQKIIDDLTAPTDGERIAKDEAAKPTVVGVFKSPVDKRFLVFTSTHEDALETASKPLTLDVTANHNRLVRSWNSFVEEKIMGVPCTHFIPEDQRKLYEDIFNSGKQPELTIVERADMTRIERSKARQRYAAKLAEEGFKLGSQSWN